MVLGQAGADARRLRTLRNLRVAAGVMTALIWISALAVVFRHLPSLYGLHTLDIPLVLAFGWFFWNSSQFRGHKWAMTMQVIMIVSGFFWLTGAVIELWK